LAQRAYKVKTTNRSNAMYVLGIDVGTTGTKSAVIDMQGNIVGMGYQGYNLYPAIGGVVEQDANDWWEAVVYSVREATAGLPDKSSIAAIALSTQGASMVPVDSRFEPMCPVLTWMDTRATAEAKAMAEQLGPDYLYRTSGFDAGAELDAAKILWMRNNRREIFAKANSFVSTIEFVNYKLTGHNVSDPTNSAIRQLIDIRTHGYDDEILSAIGIGEDRLPKVEETGSQIGKITTEAAAALGLEPTVQVFNGAHDQYCAALGCGATAANTSLLSTGTSWVLLAVTDKLVYTDSRVHPGIHPVKGLYGALASLGAVGRSLQWIRDNLSSDDYDAINAQAAGRRDSAKNLFAFPFFAGAGFPHNDVGTHAALFGLELRHDRYDIARAMMEGVVFETRTALVELARNGCDVNKLRIMGGASKSLVWRKLIADITGCETTFLKEPEACCMGAGIIASVGIGAYGSYQEAAAQMVKVEQASKIDEEDAAFYSEKYSVYQQLLNRWGLS
jgi:sugar (pentulose or hexulose) kinase